MNDKKKKTLKRKIVKFVGLGWGIYTVIIFGLTLLYGFTKAMMEDPILLSPMAYSQNLRQYF